MKKILSVIIAVLILATITNTTVYATDKEESATELYKRDRDAFYKKYMCLDDEAEEEGLYSDANNGAYTKKNKSNKLDSKKSQTTSNSGSYTIVYGADELHVVGLPTDEQGYTRAGKYYR